MVEPDLDIRDMADEMQIARIRGHVYAIYISIGEVDSWEPGKAAIYMNEAVEFLKEYDPQVKELEEADYFNKDMESLGGLDKPLSEVISDAHQRTAKRVEKEKEQMKALGYV
jgi:hypothetical protein